VTALLRDTYIKFLTEEYKIKDPELVKKKNNILRDLRKKTKEIQKSLESVISSLANIMSSQTTSKRIHDLKRLVR
jgi:uracil phosphoribosyltransferase